MKRLVILLLLFVVLLVCAVAHVNARYRPLAVCRYNKILGSFISNCTELTAYQYVPVGYSWQTRKAVQVTNRETVRAILGNLLVRDYFLRMEGHGCGGGVKVEIVHGGATNWITFDHSESVASTLVEGMGYRMLPAANVTNLIALYRALGFTDREIQAGDATSE